MDVKSHLPSKNLPVHYAAFPHSPLIPPPPCSGVLAGSFQIAFTKREVEAVGGASWTGSQFDYLRASLAEAWPGGSAQARCSWFSDFTNWGSHEERWYLYESLTSLQSLFFSDVALTSLPCHRDREPRGRSAHLIFTCSPQPNVLSSLVWGCGWGSKMPVLLVSQLESGEAYLPSRSNTNCQLGILSTSQLPPIHTHSHFCPHPWLYFSPHSVFLGALASFVRRLDTS